MKQKIFALLAFVMTVMTASATDVPTYNLIVDTNDHGNIVFTVNGVEATEAAEGAEVTVTIKPDEHWVVKETWGQWVAVIAAARGERRLPGSGKEIDLLNSFKLTFVSEDASTGSKTYKFTMERADAEISATYKKVLDHPEIVVEPIADMTYTGKECIPTIVVRNRFVTMVEGVDYTLSYSNNIDACTSEAANAPTVTITAVEGSETYVGEITRTFTILPKAFESSMIGDIAAVTYNGTAFEPDPVVTYNGMTLEKGAERDYTVSYSNNVNAGTAKVTVTAAANTNYTGSAEKAFTINPKPLTSDGISVTVAEATYTGEPQEPEVVVYDGQSVLVEGKDYTLRYEDNTNAGEGTVVVTGKGNYTGTLSETFAIKKADGLVYFRPWKFTKTYGDENFTVTPIVKADGVLIYRSNEEDIATVDRETGEVTIRGIGKAMIWVTLSGGSNYESDADWYELIVLPKSMGELTVGAIADQTYCGSALTPEVVVYDGTTVLVEGVDYTAEYKDNLLPGEATVTVTAMGNYAGTQTARFTIRKADVALTAPTPKIGMLYTGEEIELVGAGEADGGELLYSLDGESYGSEVPTAVDAGEYTVYYKVVGDANHNDVAAKSLTASIAPARLTAAELKETEFTFTGQEQTAEVASVKAGLLDVPEDCYEVSGTTATDIGAHAVTITGKGNFSGTIELSFFIGDDPVYKGMMSALKTLRTQNDLTAGEAGDRKLTDASNASLEENREAIDEMISAMEKQLNEDRAQGKCEEKLSEYTRQLGDIAKAERAFGERVAQFPLMGDTNGDGVVDIDDYVAMGQMILTRRPMPTGDLFLALDLNGDGKIGVGDLTGEVNLWMDRDWNDGGAESRETAVLQEWVSISTGSQVGVALSSDRRYTAFLMDVVLPEGMELKCARLSDRCTVSHELRVVTLDDGSIRLLCSSTVNDTFSGTDGVLVSLDVTTTAAYRGGQAELRSAVFATPETTEYALGSAGTTGISATRVNSVDAIYGLDGIRRDVPQQGVGIVRRSDGSSVKVMMRQK